MTIRLTQIIEHLGFLTYEMVLVAGALVILIVGLFDQRTVVVKVLFVLTLVISLFFVDINNVATGLVLSDALDLSVLAQVMKLLFSSIAVWVVFYPTATHHSEYYFILLALILGSSLMLNANHLLVVYLAVELTSYSSYLITSFGFQKKGFEAGIKYLLFGGTSSAIMLYGISLIYGFTGTMSLVEIGDGVITNTPLFSFGLLCFLGGILFKVSIVPFHLWVPSTYQEAPTDAVAILSTLPKVAGFVLLHHALKSAGLNVPSWINDLMMVLGISTIILGTLGAIRQSNPKRLLAYGAIAHSGLLLAVILIPGETSGIAFLWYSVVYCIMNMAAFHLISLHEHQLIDEIKGYSALGKGQPYVGGLLLLVLISLVGLPPTAGFTAKFYLFSAMWAWYQEVFDPLILAYLITGVLSVLVSLFFYLKIPFEYFISSADRHISIDLSVSSKILATIFVIVLLWLFFSPEILNKIAFHINFIDW